MQLAAEDEKRLAVDDELRCCAAFFEVPGTAFCWAKRKQVGSAPRSRRIGNKKRGIRMAKRSLHPIQTACKDGWQISGIRWHRR